DHRAQGEPGRRVEDARRERDAEHVVDEGEEEVLADVAHGAAREPPGAHDPPQVAAHERHPGALERDVGARAHRDADVGAGEGRRRRASGRVPRSPGSTPISSRSARLPSATVRPRTTPVTPLPVTEWKPSTGAGSMPRARAPATIAAARGCSLARSRLAAR